MKQLLNLFKPITANILNESDTYTEIAPCDALRPYIRCFWGSPLPYRIDNDGKSLVIPDCCMDIIFNIDYTNNIIDNLFCSINDVPFYASGTKNSAMASNFGIRFNFWTVHLFADRNLPKKCNEFAAVDNYFISLRKEIENTVIQYSKIEERIYHVERVLLRRLCSKSLSNNNLLNGVYYILKSKGITAISEISQYTCISSRQLERIFKECIGITPKKCCSLVRYQNIWKDLAFNRYVNLSDITYNYGYSDQAHMTNDFKKYHGSTPIQVIKALNR